MDKCKFLRQKKQVQINGEWVDTRSYRYIPYCDGGTPSVTIKGGPVNEKIEYWTYNTEKEISHWDVNLDENGNGYFELKDDEILYRVYLPTYKGYVQLPIYPLSEVDIKGCNVATANPFGGYGKIVFSCSTIISDEPNYGEYAHSAYCGAYSYIYNGVDTSKSTNMAWMFKDCSGITSLDLSGWDTSNVTDMNEMFYECSGLTSLDVSNFDTSNVTNMYSMFYYCARLSSLNVSSFDTSNVTRMGGMFCGCSGLTSLDLSGWNTSKATEMTAMFTHCSSLTSVNLSSFDTSNVTDMDSMFEGCSCLTSLDVSSFDTSNVTTMESMFSNCSSLKSLDLSHFNTSKVTNMESMFMNTYVTSLDLSSFDTSNVINMVQMFYGTDSSVIYVSDKFVTDKVTNSSSMFTIATNLVGGAGTVYNSSNVDKTYARVDGGTSSPGYFTLKN